LLPESNNLNESYSRERNDNCAYSTDNGKNHLIEGLRKQEAIAREVVSLWPRP